LPGRRILRSQIDRRACVRMEKAMSTKEAELLRDLDLHDDLVRKCACDELSFPAFEKAYDAFYPRYALDGHESDAEERRLLEKYESRVALHRAIWDDVLTQVTADEYLAETKRAGGFIGSVEAQQRIRDLFRRYSATR
jgi:hypothetical protein